MSVGKLVEGLSCLTTVDVMLLEGVPVVDVAKFIQKDQGELTDINEKTLANALGARRLQRQEVDGYFGARIPRVDIDDLDDSADGNDDRPRLGEYRRRAQTPSILTRNLYKRTEEGIKHMVELEGLYLAAKDRIDRWMELEAEAGAFSDRCGQEIVNAANIMAKHFEIAQELGLVEGGDRMKLTLDFKRYSAETAKVLSNPESRHRVISLVERLAQHAKKAAGVTMEMEQQEPVALPMPKASGDDE
jgi:hypothetical protein